MKTVAQTVIEADHFYTIAAHTGNVIQAVEGTKEAGTVRLGKYEHKPEQEWSFIRVGDGVYRIRNRASGKLLDLTMTGTANGTWLHLWEDVGGTSQMWTVQPTPEGTVRLRSSWAGGKCVDTSMGLTPLEGLIMGTRSGDVDPAVLQFVMNKEGMDINEMLNILNKKSGIYGMTNGISSDFRDIEKAKAEGNHLAEVALDAFYYRVAKYIGAYTAAMNGVDAIAFTAGVGENDKVARKTICGYLGFMGVAIDDEANDIRGEERVISTADSKVKVMLIPTNEELAIARETKALV